MKLKIGLFNESFPPTIDGVSNAVYNYAKVITEKYSKCTVVTPKYPMVVDNYPFKVYRHSSFDFVKRIGYRVGNILSLKTLKDLSDEKFDIIHVHSPFASAVLASQVSQFNHRLPIVFTYHTKFDVDIKKRVQIKSIQRIALRLVLSNINRADEVWVVTEGAVESLRNLGYKGKYRVMENGTDFPKGQASQLEIDEVNRIFRLDDNKLTFLFVGRMMWYKNIKLILDSLKLLGDDVDYHMIFVGDGMDRPSIEQYTHSIGLSGKVSFAGAVYDRERVRAFFSRADLFLFPSTYDTAGLVVKEAAACSLPSLLVEKSCPAEGVEDGFSGFLCKENAYDMAKVIRKAVSDKEALKQVGKNAEEHVYLSWEDAIDKAYKRYEEIAEGWPRKLPYRKNK